MGSWVKRPDTWVFGIPNFTGMYTYFEDLQENGGPMERRKHALWTRASAEVAKDIGKLEVPENIENANQFLSLIAESERAKEIKMIRTFCKQTGQSFPILESYLQSPSTIADNLDEFYSVLTAAINKARRGTEEYHKELLRIKQNLNDSTRTLKNYKEDDYRYRLIGDMESFIRRITGNFVVSKETPNSFASQVQSLTLRILKKMNIAQQISSGEDFVAIAASTLIEVERQVQKELDIELNQGYDARKKLDEQIDKKILKKIEDRYTDIASKAKLAESPVEKALNNVNGDEFNRIIANAKDILNIKTEIKTENEIAKLKDTIRKRDARARQKNQEIANIRSQIMDMIHSDELNLISFKVEGSELSKHGNIYELIESIFQDGFKVSGNMATDIITYKLGWNIQQDNAQLAELSETISKIYTEAYSELQSLPKDEIRNTQTILSNMNKKIDQLIKESEKQMRDLKEKLNLDDIFIFHESLKLSSSAETGRNKHGGGFQGRKMSIMSYIDALYTMQDSFSFPLDRASLGFLALNLVPRAVAEDQKDVLEQYLSIYAGMVMFDDLANMAQEAVTMINAFSSSTSGRAIQIHLYNLNGIYVPASMILSYLSDAVNETTAQITANAAAKAHITTKPNEKYGAYLSLRNSGQPYNLSPETWAEVAANSASKTQVSITFLASFKAFIEKLGF